MFTDQVYTHEKYTVLLILLLLIDEKDRNVRISK